MSYINIIAILGDSCCLKMSCCICGKYCKLEESQCLLFMDKQSKKSYIVWWNTISFVLVFETPDYIIFHETWKYFFISVCLCFPVVLSRWQVCVFFFYRKWFSLRSTVDMSSEAAGYGKDFISEEAAGEGGPTLWTQNRGLKGSEEFKMTEYLWRPVPSCCTKEFPIIPLLNTLRYNDFYCLLWPGSLLLISRTLAHRQVLKLHACPVQALTTFLFRYRQSCHGHQATSSCTSVLWNVQLYLSWVNFAYLCFLFVHA